MAEHNGNNAGAKRVFAIGSVLFVICALSALSLSIVNALTRGSIEANTEKKEKKAIEEIASGGIIGEKAGLQNRTITARIPIYSDTNRKNISGFCLRLKSPNGYSGDLELLAVYKVTGELEGARLIENKETPGLGKKAEDPAYMNKFIGLGGSDDKKIPRTKEMLDAGARSQRIPSKNSGTGTGIADLASFFCAWMFGAPGTESVDSVTGATITFEAIAVALYEGSEHVKKLNPIKETEAQPESSGGVE